jgi:hypothetical protein
MYHEVADSPLSAIDHIMAGGDSGGSDRDMAINSAKAKAISNFKQQYAIQKSAEMLHDLEVKKTLRNIDAEKVDWTGQAVGLFAVALIGLVTYKAMK